MKRAPQRCMFGISAEFETAKELVKAAKQSRAAGYTNIKAYTPYYVDGLDAVLKHKSNWLQWLALIMIFIGVLAGFFLQYYSDVLVYPLNIGGRPFLSWPSFMQVTFELGILFAGLGILGGMFIANGFPAPYHPIFNAPNIESASRNHFFLCIEVTDKQFDLVQTQEFLQSLDPITVSEVQC